MPSKEFRFSVLSGRLIIAMVTLLVTTGCHQSKPIPAEIVGDSMAPLLCGAHLSQRCPQCDYAFNCRTGQDLTTIQCGHCGSQFAPQGKTRPVDRVQVMPGQMPQRWDIIAFEHNRSTMIKRVVGLPEETVSIADGNILIDQTVAVKPDAISAQTQRLVFDSHLRHAATPNGPAQYDFSLNHWKNDNGTIVHRPRETSHQRYDWIQYRHQRNYPHSKNAADVNEATATLWPPIQDNNSFNQNVGRKLNEVHELTIQLDLKMRYGSVLQIQKSRPQGTYLLTLRVDPSSPQYQITFSDGQPLTTTVGTLKTAGERPFVLSLSFSNIDGRIKVAVDGEVIIDQRDRIFETMIQPKTQNAKLKFGFSDASWGGVARCRIWRDIHYFAESAPPKFELPLTMGQGEYFVLGDNVAVSRDSRHFGPIKKVIGVVQQ